MTQYRNKRFPLHRENVLLLFKEGNGNLFWNIFQGHTVVSLLVQMLFNYYYNWDPDEIVELEQQKSRFHSSLSSISFIESLKTEI